jgi:hypothetical protein
MVSITYGVNTIWLWSTPSLKRLPRVDGARPHRSLPELLIAVVDELQRHWSLSAGVGADPSARSTSTENPKYRYARADIEVRNANM